jgi:glutamate N-acetyltransferase/amino-acid N-acetyltransferase
LDRAVDRTFNRISIDACESTNDSVFLFATKAAGPVDDVELGKSIEAVCADLAEQIVRDAEGGTKFVRVRITGAATESKAAAAGKAVAASALWRAALAGGDPNWGRVVSALGAADRGLDTDRVSVRLGGAVVFDGGEPVRDLAEAARAMSAPEVLVECALGAGTATAEILSADLTIDYVMLNSEGTS